MGCDYSHLDRNLELFIGNSEILNKAGLFEQSEYEKYRDRYNSNVNLKTSGLVLYTSIQFIYFIKVYYSKATQEEIIPCVLPLSYNYRDRRTKIYIEIQHNLNSEDNKYDLCNLVEFLSTQKTNNKIINSFSGANALGIYDEKKDIFVDLQDLLAYQNKELYDSIKIDAINSVIELNKHKKVSNNVSKGVINPLKSTKILAPYLPVSIRFDEQEHYNYITLSKYNLDGMFRTLTNSLNKKETSSYILDDNFDVRLIEILGASRKQLATNKGVKQLFLRNPELKEVLVLMNARLNGKKYDDSSSEVNNFANVKYIHSLINEYFNNYEGKRDKRTRLYNLNNYGGVSIDDQIITLLSLFAFKLYDCITNYGRYTHSFEHLKSEKDTSRDDPWIYRISINFQSIARQEWNKFITWYLNHDVFLESELHINTISNYLDYNKINKKTNPSVFGILTSFQHIFFSKESMPLVNQNKELSIEQKVSKMQYDYIWAEVEKYNISLFNKFNLVKFAFYDTVIRVRCSLMNIGTKKRKYYFQSIDNSVRKVLSSLTENDNSINDENANCIIDLEKARLLSYMTNTQLIQRQY
ncbi:MAG: hypothetical protein KAU62_13745 [Candidatus Heimdallarchaeota archaeon]|nr:hypothetical protein [Candidatus Heimdallarchaeota archaeon]MCG3257155.1 hypothetical protein [Candidatus Heimdallarchaeota archaeon]MCK4612215.1 hypothetical protein [Candidatus Heimdallarchaeota archaeon]